MIVRFVPRSRKNKRVNICSSGLVWSSIREWLRRCSRWNPLTNCGATTKRTRPRICPASPTICWSASTTWGDSLHNQNGINTGGMSWLGFELSVLRRLKFRSVALPLAGEPHLGQYLKRLNVSVAANDPAEWAWTKSLAFIENNSEVLTESDIELVLTDAYVPANYFRNSALLSWFNETDAWWFDNVRANVE